MKNYDILKKNCVGIFWVGSGNFWFEEEGIGNHKSLLYRFYSTMSYLMYSIMVVLEVMAALIGDFPKDKKRETMSLAICHTIVMIKLFFVICNKTNIKKLHVTMIHVCEQYEAESLLAQQFRIMKINVVAYFVLVFSSVCFGVVEGLVKWADGSHFVTLVTYYPSHENNSVMATICRLWVTFIAFPMMMTMLVTVDSLTLVYLIMYKYKFITLRMYFENIRAKVVQLYELRKTAEAADKMAQGLMEGIVMHGELLRLFSEIDGAFGLVMTLQLCLSSGTAVSLLLEITISDLSVATLIKNVGFLSALFSLLGIFLCNAGEITHQAALVSEAIYSCGWHVCPTHHGRHHIRKLVIFSIMQAQQPLVMLAFKMVELTHDTFIQVAKGTYSIFTLLYARHE